MAPAEDELLPTLFASIDGVVDEPEDDDGDAEGRRDRDGEALGELWADLVGATVGVAV